MNFPPTHTIPSIPLSGRDNLPNYLLSRSFQPNNNFSESAIRHYTVPRSVSNSVAAGEHFFEYFIGGFAIPVITVLYSLTPAFASSLPIVHLANNQHFGGRY